MEKRFRTLGASATNENGGVALQPDIAADQVTLRHRRTSFVPVIYFLYPSEQMRPGHEAVAGQGYTRAGSHPQLRMGYTS